MTSRFEVNTYGLATSPSRWSRYGSLVLAEANTSAGSPCWICAASMFEPPNE
jgi:hypothetical protein